MQIEEFTLERIQSLYENLVEFNLSDSGVHPYSLNELLTAEQREELMNVELGYGWTNGSVELREAIARIYKDRTADNVIVTNGSAEANFILVMSLLDPGEEAVVVVPNYLQIHGWAKAVGAVVTEVQLREELGWTPDFDELRRVVSPKTKLLTICNPSNPTGAVLSRSQMDELIAIARDNDIYLHVDEVYRGAEFDGVEMPSFADLYEKTIVTSGLSKAMALPGLRIGWLVGPAAEIYATWQCKDYTSITTGAISEYVARHAVEPAKREEILSRSKRILLENLALVQAWVDENSDLVSFVPPKAGGMAFIRYHHPINSTELVHAIREKHSVMLVPGDAYGLDGHFRIGIGAPASHLEPGLKRVAEHLRSLS